MPESVATYTVESPTAVMACGAPSSRARATHLVPPSALAQTAPSGATPYSAFGVGHASVCSTGAFRTGLNVRPPSVLRCTPPGVVASSTCGLGGLTAKSTNSSLARRSQSRRLVEVSNWPAVAS